MPPNRIIELCDSSERVRKRLAESLILSIEQRNQIRGTADVLLSLNSLARITNHDVFHLWLQHCLQFAIEGRCESFSEHLRANCAACHALDLEQTLNVLSDYEFSLERDPVPHTCTLSDVTSDREAFIFVRFDSDTILELVAFRVAESLDDFRYIRVAG